MSDVPLTVLPSDRFDKRIHVALPIRVTYWDAQNRPKLEMACTYDISPHGARVVGLRSVKQAGDIVALERGRMRVFCRVAWIGEDNSELKGQIGLQCVESDKLMWESEMRQMQEIYEPLPGRGRSEYPARQGEPARRGSPRFAIDGVAELLRLTEKTHPGMEAPIKNLGRKGCLVASPAMLGPGTNLRLVLNVGNYDFTVKGEVRYAAQDRGLGIEFMEIRKGDGPVLQYILRKLAERAADIDVTAEAHAAGSL